MQERVEEATAGKWREVTLGDLINIKHGFAFKGSFFRVEPQGDILLTPGNFAIGGGFKGGNLKYYDGEIPEGFVLQEGDLLVTMTDLSKQSDTLGYPAFVPANADGRRYLHNQRLGKIVANSSAKLDLRYIYYLMCSDEYRDEVLASATGTTVKHTSPGRIKQFRFSLPPLPEQHAIAHILGTLDDKIELNRGMNQTVEEMARALFKSWFVDFDPVRAKAALKQHALRQHATLDGEPSGNGDTPSAFGYHSPFAGEPGGDDDAPSAFRHHSPLEGESARRGALAPSSRWGETQRTDSTWKDIQRSYSKKTLEQAKALRQRQTDAEGLLWHYLRKKQLGGYKFRRQQPIGPYIVDFACMPEKLLVELDGGQHAERAAHDERRDAFLRSKGVRVLRFWNNEVFENRFGVLERVYEALPSPPPRQTEPAGSTAATPPQGGSDGTPSLLTGSTPSPLDSTPSPLTDAPSPLKGEGWSGGAPAPTGEWTVERARAYLSGMDPEIVDLFPDRLVDSELGGIPEGWEVTKLGESASVSSGRRPSVRNPIASAETPIPVWGANGPMAYTSDPLTDGSIVLTGRVGTLGSLFRITEPCWPSDNTLVVRVTNSSFFDCLYFQMKRIDFSSLNRGSTQPLLAQSDLQEIRVLSPSQDILECFHGLTTTFFDYLKRATMQSDCLATQRDALLPRMISGEMAANPTNSREL